MKYNFFKDYREYLVNQIETYSELQEGLIAKGKDGTASAYGIWKKAFQYALVEFDKKTEPEDVDPIEQKRIDNAQMEYNSIVDAQNEYNKEKCR